MNNIIFVSAVLVYLGTAGVEMHRHQILCKHKGAGVPSENALRHFRHVGAFNVNLMDRRLGRHRLGASRSCVLEDL